MYWAMLYFYQWTTTARHATQASSWLWQDYKCNRRFLIIIIIIIWRQQVRTYCLLRAFLWRTQVISLLSMQKPCSHEAHTRRNEDLLQLKSGSCQFGCNKCDCAYSVIRSRPTFNFGGHSLAAVPLPILPLWMPRRLRRLTLKRNRFPSTVH